MVLQRQGGAGVVRVACKVYYCQEESLCLFKQVVFEVPLSDAAPAAAQVAVRFDVPEPLGAGVPGFGSLSAAGGSTALSSRA